MRRAAAALAVVLAVVAGGCSVGNEAQPRAMSPDDVPFGLLDAPSIAPPTTTEPGRRTTNVTLYFVRQGKLVPSARVVPAPAPVGAVLQLLLEGPTERESREGLQSAISPATRLLDVSVDGAVAQVNLSASFVESRVQDQTAAVAQIVVTAAGLPGIRGVTFALAGRPVEVPAADNTLRRGTLTPADYAALIA